LPTLKGVLLETGENGLILSATDLELGIKCSVDCQVTEHGAIVLPAKLLTEFIRKMPEGMVTIKLDPENSLKVTVSSLQVNFDLSGFAAEEYPRLPNIKGEASKIRMSEGTLREMFLQTEVAVAKDETRPVLTGLLMETEGNKMKIVATDGHRLAFRQANTEEDYSLKVVIPGKVIKELIKILEDNPEKYASVYVDKSDIVFDLQGIVISSRLIAGKYPPYQQIIPSDFKTSVVVETREMQASLERAEIIAREGGNNLVKLEIDDKGIRVFATSPDIGNVEEYVSAIVEGEPVEIRFNVQLLLDCFRNIRDQQVNIDLTGPFSPCMIRPVQDHNYLHLVLPVRIS
jgi:DNA polymerase-3 subunit beta